MSKDSSWSVYPRFAVSSLIAIALVTTLVCLVSAPYIRRANERAAAQSAASGVAAPLRSMFEPLAAGATVPDDVPARAQALAGPLVVGDLKGLRVWSAGGQPVVAVGVGWSGARPSVPQGGFTWARTSASDGSRLFVTFAQAGAYTIEVDQSVAGVDSAIAAGNNNMIALAIALALSCFALAQAMFWLAVRRLAARHSWLLRLHNRGDAIRSSLDLHDVVTQVAMDAAAVAAGSYGLVALYDEGTGDLILRGTFSRETGETALHERAIEAWFLRRCVATNTSIVTTQSKTACRQIFGPEVEDGGELALACAPLALRDRAVGAIAVARPAGGRRTGFSPDEVRRIEQIADQAVTAVEQAILFAKVRAYADEIEIGYDATLKALMAALDAKDEATEGHCERVAKLTLQLARRMGVPERQLVDVERGALLHDVGKIGVPDAVLQKPKELNDGEWEAMRKHPLLATLMVSKIGFLEGALPILMYHHERYDGSGYPFGLVTDKIPLEARVFAVVDAYDAMTSDRPYRSAMSHDEAMSEVAANSGGQFDPEVVTQFEGLMAARPELRHQCGGRLLAAEHDEHDRAVAPADADAA